MYHRTIFHSLPDGAKAKFTIRDRIIDGERFFYSNAINIELDVYKNLTGHEKDFFWVWKLQMEDNNL